MNETKPIHIINLDTPDNTEDAKQLVSLIEPFLAKTKDMGVNRMYNEMVNRLGSDKGWNVHRHGYKFQFSFNNQKEALKFGSMFDWFSYTARDVPSTTIIAKDMPVGLVIYFAEAVSAPLDL